MADHFVGAVKEMHQKMKSSQSTNGNTVTPADVSKQITLAQVEFLKTLKRYPQLLYPKTGK